MYRLEYMYQCIRINPTVKCMYHVYSFVLATACAVYASKVLPYAVHTLAIFQRMRRLRQQVSTACAAYASKELPHAPRTLAICNRMRRIRLQKPHFYTILQAYAPSALAICQRMRRIRQQRATACAAYASKVLPHAPHTLAKLIAGYLAILTKSSLNQ